jgi:hypothetical protein
VSNLDEDFVKNFSLIGFVIIILALASAGYIDFANIYHILILFVGLGIYIWLSNRAIDEVM